MKHLVTPLRDDPRPRDEADKAQGSGDRSADGYGVYIHASASPSLSIFEKTLNSS